MRPSTKKKCIRISFSLLMVFLFLSLPFTSLLLFHHYSERCYQATYYGEFLPLFSLLKSRKQEKKVVLIGTSSVPFGFDSALFEKEAQSAGMPYFAIGYGLYGSLGTKIMMETALPHIGKGDIVILSPELYTQTLSCYFSGIETYRAIEGNNDILPFLTGKERKDLALSLPSFAAEKSSFLVKGKKAEGSGIYAKSSFDQKGNLRKGLRKENEMDGYWSKTSISPKITLFERDFIDYANDFASALASKGASVYYRLCPINRLALPSDYEALLSLFYDELTTKLHFPILGNPFDSVIPENYFYDSDFHLNDAGCELNTLRIVKQLKTELGNAKSNIKEEPIPPELPQREKTEYFGDDSCDSSFLYEKNGESYAISSLSEEGKKMDRLILPTHHEGLPITAIKEDSLPSVSLKSLTIQKNIDYLPDNLLSKLPNLESLHLQEEDPSMIHVGWGLLNEAGKVTIFVPKGSLQRYRLDYFWSHYASALAEENV